MRFEGLISRSRLEGGYEEVGVRSFSPDRWTGPLKAWLYPPEKGTRRLEHDHVE